MKVVGLNPGENALDGARRVAGGAIIRTCDICGTVTAVDLCATQRSDQSVAEMKLPGQTIRHVLSGDAKRLWASARNCNCDREAFPRKLSQYLDAMIKAIDISIAKDIASGGRDDTGYDQSRLLEIKLLKNWMSEYGQTPPGNPAECDMR